MKKAFKLLLISLFAFIPLYVFAEGEESNEEVVDEIKVVASISKGNNNSLVLSWNSIGEGTSCDIYRSTKEKSGYSKIKTTTDVTYTNGGLTYGKTYYFKVTCTHEENKITSNIVHMQVKPNKVVNVKLTPGNKQIKVSYSKVGVSGYQIQRSTDNKKWTTVKTVRSSKTLSYTNTRLSTNKTYYYRVRAYKTVWGRKTYGAWSDVISTKTAPAAPKYSLKSLSYNKMGIVISKASGATTYQVYRSTSKRSGYKRVGILEGNGTYEDTPVTPQKTYYYKVRACNENGTCGSYGSVYSKKTSVKTPTLTNKSTVYSNLTWTNIDYATKYEVYYATSKNGKYSKIATVSENSYSKKGLKIGKTYYYKVRMYVEVSGKKYYSGYSNIVSSKPYVGKISDLNLTVNGTKVGVSFVGAPDVTGYVLYRSRSESGPFEEVMLDMNNAEVSSTDNTVSFIVPSEEFTLYYIKLRAFASVSGTKYYGAYSEIKTIETGSRIPPEYVPVMEAVHELEGQFMSRKSLRELLKDDFSEDEINYAIENYEIDWRIPASDSVNMLLEEEETSKADLEEMLAYEEFTESEINFALSEHNFNELALSLVKKDIYKYYSEVEVRELLSQRNFTNDNIDYAVSHVTDDFANVAYDYAFVNSLHKTIDELRTMLSSHRFTEEQINTAINRINENVYSVSFKSRKVENEISVGDTLLIGGEEFNVLSTNESETELLAKNPIIVGNGAIHSAYYERQGIITNNIGTVPFNLSNYWHDEDENNVLSDYGEEYPANVYDANSSINNQIGRYIDLLNNLNLIEITSGRILSLDDLKTLGCTEEYDYYNPECSLAPSWLTTNPSNTPIWLGTAVEKNKLMTLNGARLGKDTFLNNNAVRPILVVNTADLSK